ncbi:STAS-like domain-containing protein [Opitutus sp. GAS368]|uniref:STAS-like domain-containing protein n=1 Tax=Opitutus sp. GAS368 TaxID=1882749 RepID=UPI00087BE60A|nr:STAS-like domain-containing protein [Opitutus sp. GAS368]SDS02337.1 protein of unknown function [Opitutus sp. GAS368]
MKHELFLATDFGPQLADGEAASCYRLARVEPYLSLCEQVVLDFTGVRSANSSFVNALVAGIVEQHGQDVLHKVAFKGCNPVVRVLVEAAIALGLRKVDGRVDA